MGARRVVVRAVVAFLAVVVWVSWAVAGSAQAGLTHKYVSSFEKGPGEPFSGVEGVAVDQASGDVYVYDAGAGGGAGAIYKFDASGNPVGFSGIAGESNVITGVGGAGEGEGELAVDSSASVAKGDIYLATGSGVKVYSAAGLLLGEIAEGAGHPWGRPCGVAVGSAGQVYVGLAPNGSNPNSSVNQYAPTTSPVSSVDYASSLWGLNDVCNVAVDSAGSVYADTLNDGPVTKYEALQFSSVEVPASGTQVSERARAVAVDPSTQDLYAARWGEVLQYEQSGTLLDYFYGEFAILHGIAANGASGRLYLGDNQYARIDIFGPTVVIPDVTTGPATNLTTTGATLTGTVNPDGLPITSCTFEYSRYNETNSVPCTTSPGSGTTPVEVSANVTGLTPNTGYYYRLVVSNENGTVYGEPPLSFTTLSPPLVDEQWVEGVSVSTVTVNAKINPKGFASVYQLEYGPDTSYGTRTPVPAASIGAGEGDVAVSQNLAGLEAGTTYHYRFVATSANGTTDGPDRTFKTSPAPTVTTDTCPNAQIRGLQAAQFLPDCRAYEMVSPPDKDGGNISGSPSNTRAAVNGNAVQYISITAFGDAHGTGTFGLEYAAERSDGGWVTHAITPTQTPPPIPGYVAHYLGDLSGDLNSGVFFSASPLAGAEANVANVPSLYLRTDLLKAGYGSYQLLSGCPLCAEPLPARGPSLGETNPALDGTSADFSHVLFESTDNLTPEASGYGPKLYEWVKGTTRLAGILPDSACGAPPCVAEESVAGQGAYTRAYGYAQREVATYNLHTISSNGSRIVFTAGPFTPNGEGGLPGSNALAGNLYLRENGTTTVKLNASERSEPGPELPARYLNATPDDSKIFFETAESLTGEDTYPGLDLYMYDVNAPEHHLTLITPPKGSIETVPGTSEDGSYVYFTSEAGQENPLYVWHDGTIRFIADKSGVNFGQQPLLPYAFPYLFRVTRDGKHVLFASNALSAAQSVGYDSHCGNGFCQEVYLYDYDTNKLTCVSCNPSGERPVGSAGFMTNTNDVTGVGAAGSSHLNRAMTEDASKIFFDTPDALVPEDTNGKSDVYEYDVASGKVSLISSGRSADESLFVEATPNGSDVFFTTSERLVRAEIDSNFDLYDARVDGGIPAQNVAPPAQCESDDCQGPAKAAPVFSLPSSLTFEGAGNPMISAKAVASARSKGLTRSQKLKRALRVCRRKHGRQRRVCERTARRRFGAVKSSVRTVAAVRGR